MPRRAVLLWLPGPVLGLGLGLGLGLAAAPAPARAESDRPLEIRHRLRPDAGLPPRAVALTLDACGGGFDAPLIARLVAQRIPATLFVTRHWLERHPQALRELLAHADLFELENHGSEHVPAIVGPQRTLFGMAGHADVAQLRHEVLGAAQRIGALSGRAPQYYRAAGAAYDSAARRALQEMGVRIAGFSVNADAGASLPAADVAARLRSVQPGDVIIAHMNRPAGGTAQGLALAMPEWRSRGLNFVKLSQVRLIAP